MTEKKGRKKSEEKDASSFEALKDAFEKAAGSMPFISETGSEDGRDAGASITSPFDSSVSEKISADRFSKISASSSSDMCFVDGGIGEIMVSPSVSVYFLRSAFSIFKKNNQETNREKRESAGYHAQEGEAKQSERKEFIVVISVVPGKTGKASSLNYRARVIPATHPRQDSERKESSAGLPAGLPDELTFNLFDIHLREGKKRASMQSIISVVRKLAELSLAEEALAMLGEGSMLVLDGNLEAAHPVEEERMGSLFEAAAKKDVLVCAVSKTSRMLASDGDLVSARLARMAGQDATKTRAEREKKEDSKGPGSELRKYAEAPWMYSTGITGKVSGKDVAVFFAKLNGASEHVFRVDVLTQKKLDAGRMMALLCGNSRDAAFPGYPYGLMYADRIARVSNSELEYFRTMFLSMFGEKVKPYMSSLDAHSVLDSIY